MKLYALCPECVSPNDSYSTKDEWWCDSCGIENEPNSSEVSWTNERWVRV